ncbi:MAG: DUF5679 domain-containing protein [Chloroflexota bacterium]
MRSKRRASRACCNPGPLTACCVKCRAKHEIKDPRPVFTANDSPATRGSCLSAALRCSPNLREGRLSSYPGMERMLQDASQRNVCCTFLPSVVEYMHLAPLVPITDLESGCHPIVFHLSTTGLCAVLYIRRQVELKGDG